MNHCEQNLFPKRERTRSVYSGTAAADFLKNHRGSGAAAFQPRCTSLERTAKENRNFTEFFQITIQDNHGSGTFLPFDSLSKHIAQCEH
jgi:hypothetical protein